jgi:hypothetical protein
LGETLYGDVFVLPEQSLVTSRFDPDNPREAHYALVCRSASPLVFEGCEEKLVFGDLRNILSGKTIGPSQVTSVVERLPLTGENSRSYDVAFRARLAEPFLVRLHEPFPVRVLEDRISRETDSECLFAFQSRRRPSSRQLSFLKV